LEVVEEVVDETEAVEAVEQVRACWSSKLRDDEFAVVAGASTSTSPSAFAPSCCCCCCP
jgi:hypothetical protein